MNSFLYLIAVGALCCRVDAQIDNSVNVALKQPAYERSVYASMVASNANDGKTDTSSCTTMGDVNPWWAVDLGREHRVRVVEVVNDNNAYFAYRLNNFFVKLTNVQPTPGQPLSGDTTLCAQYNGSVANMGTARVFCQSSLKLFRYVVIQGSLSTADAVCLAEVRVCGDANLASNRPAYERSVYASMVASNANDGKTDTSSCTTMGDVNPWWAVDLSKQFQVAEVEIVNDNNAYFSYRLNNFFVKLTNVQPTPGQPLSSDNTLCAQYNGSVANLGTAKVTCKADVRLFRYVVIQGSLSTADAICLAEVRAYGPAAACPVPDPCTAATNPCSNGGKCANDPANSSYTCQCTSTFSGKNCDIAVDPCNATANLCKNGGKCVGTAGTTNYTCDCPSRFTGKNCETGVDPCTVAKTLPCLNGGKCIGVAGTSSYTCECVKGFTGSKCENVDYCANSPCKNGGNCSGHNEGYKCTCTVGFIGENCDSVDHCAVNPCKNGGSCSSLVEGYACSCKTGFAGVNCTMDTTACAAVSSTSKINCGWGGVKASDCNARSCCFDSNPPAGAPACFAQATDCAAVPLSDRVNCRGTSTFMSKVLCNGRGCCYDNSATNKGPVCYRQVSKASCIGISADRRISQGTGATMPNECEARGNCWDSSVADDKLWCFSVKS